MTIPDLAPKPASEGAAVRSAWRRASPEVIEGRRRLYEDLKAEGVRHAPRTLPAPSHRGAPLPPGANVRIREEIPGGWYAAVRMRRHETLRMWTPDGTAAASVVVWNADDPTERLNHADTLKVQWTAALRRGRVLLSDMGRVLLSMTEDTGDGGLHDALAGGSGPEDTGGDPRNARSNLRLAAAKLGLDKRDIPPCVTFFAPVGVEDEAGGRLRWRDGVRAAGDFVELRAEMDLLVAVSNTRHPLDPQLALPAGPLGVLVCFATKADPGDVCRTATAEARRAFENTDPLFV